MPRKRLTEADVVAPMPEPEEPEGEGGGDEAGGEPSTRTISFGGKQFEVSADIASAWEARDEAYKRGISGQGTELGQLRQEIADLRARVAPPTSREPEPTEFDYAKYEQLSLESPTEALKFRDEFEKKQRERDKQEMRTEYLQDQRARQWRGWLDRFYEKHDDLAKDEFLVDAIFQEMTRTDPDAIALIRAGKMDELGEKVANATRTRIIGYGGKAREYRATSGGGRVAVAEGGGLREGRRAAPAAEEDEGPKSVSAAIKAKQARHKSAYSGAPMKRDYRPKPGTE